MDMFYRQTRSRSAPQMNSENQENTVVYENTSNPQGNPTTLNVTVCMRVIHFVVGYFGMFKLT